MRSHYNLYVALSCFCLIFAGSTQARQAPADTPEESPDQYTEDVFTWETSTPSATDFDWVQLVSGEWLKGEINGLFKDKLEFDSDKLDLLTLDWEDVKYLETHIPGSAYIEDHGTIYGYFEINETKIIVTNGDEITEYARSRLVSFITGGEEELDYWSTKITLGLIVRSGNTDQVDYNAKASVKRQTAYSRFIADYIGNISNTQGVETINNHRLNITHDIFKTRRFFYRPVFAQYYSDKFSNIDAQVTIGTGLGYTIIDTSRTDWDVSGGPAYQSTRFVSVQQGENIKETTPALVMGTDYEIELTKKLDFMFNYSITWGNEESGGYTHHIVTTFENEITGSFDFDISIIWDHISNPTAADDGTIPFNDDYRLTLGVTYEF